MHVSCHPDFRVHTTSTLNLGRRYTADLDEALTRTARQLGTTSPGCDVSDRAIMKVTIKTWNTVATWRWDISEDDVCGICQVHFDGTCPTCRFPGDDCSLRGLSPCWYGMKRALMPSSLGQMRPQLPHALHHGMDQAGGCKGTVPNVSSKYDMRSFLSRGHH